MLTFSCRTVLRHKFSNLVHVSGHVHLSMNTEVFIDESGKRENMLRIIFLVGLIVLEGMAFAFPFSQAQEDKPYLELVHSIKDVVITTQKTRGLTNNYMNGNVVAQLLVYGQRQNMLKNFQEVEKNIASSSLKPELKEMSAVLINKTELLNRRAFKEDSAQVFASYSDIIEGWISFNKRVIDTHFSASDAKRYKMVSTLNNVLLPLTENIGKMRGMGSGIVARSYCKKQESPKMQQFARKIEQYRMMLESYLRLEVPASLEKSELQMINESLHTYTELTLNRVVDQDHIELDTNTYFNQGTAAISNVLKVYGALVAMLDHQE